MKSLGSKRLIKIVIVVLAILIFSAVGTTFFSILNHNKSVKEESSTEVLEALSGNGTEASPYLINNMTDFNTFSESVYNGNPYIGKYVKLNCDLNFANISEYDNFTPIGAKIEIDAETRTGKMMGYSPFMGNFDGGGHIVSNLRTKDVYSTEYTKNYWGASLGFFAELGYSKNGWPNEISRTGTVNTVVKNLKISGFGVAVAPEKAFIGGIAGHACTIKASDLSVTVSVENCIVESLSIVDTYDNYYVSGLVGFSETLYTNDLGATASDANPLKISNCMVYNFYSFYTNEDGYNGENSIAVSIGPAIGLFTTAQAAEDSKSFPGDTIATPYSLCYDISYCVTDSTATYPALVLPKGSAYYTILAEVFYNCPIENGTYGFENVSLSPTYTNYSNVSESLTSNILYFENNQYWTTFEYGEEHLYLKDFLEEVSFEASPTNGGTIKLNGSNISEVGTIYLPKGDNGTISGKKINFFKYTSGTESNYLYTAEATPNTAEGYTFSEWERKPGKVIAHFDGGKLSITFKACTNSNITSDVTYTVKLDTSITISFNPYSAPNNNKYRSITFKFTDISGTSITVTYENNNGYYLVGHNLVEITKITSNTEVIVTAQLKTYSPSYG